MGNEPGKDRDGAIVGGASPQRAAGASAAVSGGGLSIQQNKYNLFGENKAPLPPQSEILRAALARPEAAEYKSILGLETEQPDSDPDLLQGLSEAERKDVVVDRLLGMIYGQALGDAMGLSTEFENRASIHKMYGSAPIQFPNYKPTFHNWHWRRGDWTDDTDQFLLILQALLELRGQTHPHPFDATPKDASGGGRVVDVRPSGPHEFRHIPPVVAPGTAAAAAAPAAAASAPAAAAAAVESGPVAGPPKAAEGTAAAAEAPAASAAPAAAAGNESKAPIGVTLANLFALKLSVWSRFGFPQCEDHGAMGMGATVSRVVGHAAFTSGDPHYAARRVYEMSNGGAAANGAVMRTAIVSAVDDFVALRKRIAMPMPMPMAAEAAADGKRGTALATATAAAASDAASKPVADNAAAASAAPSAPAAAPSAAATAAASALDLTTAELDLVSDGGLARLSRATADVARVTHWHPKAVGSCVYITHLIAGIIRRAARLGRTATSAAAVPEAKKDGAASAATAAGASGPAAGSGDAKAPTAAASVAVSSGPIPPIDFSCEDLMRVAERYAFSYLPVDGQREALTPLATMSETDRAEFRSHATGPAMRSWAGLALDDPRAIGYTLKCMGCGALAASDAAGTMTGPDDFMRVMQALAREGGDADTNGAVAGAVMGARLGYSRLPAAWLAAMPFKKWLDQYVVRFLKGATNALVGIPPSDSAGERHGGSGGSGTPAAAPAPRPSPAPAATPAAPASAPSSSPSS